MNRSMNFIARFFSFSPRGTSEERSVLWSLSEHVRHRHCNPEGCQIVAGGRSASVDPRKSAKKNLHPGGVPENAGNSMKSNEPFRVALRRFSTGLFQRIEPLVVFGKEAITVLAPATFFAEKGCLAPLRGAAPSNTFSGGLRLRSDPRLLSGNPPGCSARWPRVATLN